MATRVCPHCSASLPVEDPAPTRMRCPACRVVVNLEAPESRVRVARPSPAPGRLPERDDADDEEESDDGELSPRERIAASRELARAMRFVRALKASYVALAILVGLWFLLFLASSVEAPLTLGFGAIVVISIAGALRVERHPLRWSLLLASAATLLLVAEVLVGVVPVVLGIVVLAYWSAVSFAARIEAIVRRHPDLWLARRLRGETIEDERGAVSTKHRDRANAERKARRRRRRLLVVGTLVGVVAVGFAASRLTQRDEPRAAGALPPPAIPADATFARFREAWNGNRLDEVKAHFLPESRAKFSRGLDRIVERHAWKPLPALGTPRTTDEGRYASAVFPLAGEQGDLYTSWAWDDDTKSWGINALRPPKD